MKKIRLLFIMIWCIFGIKTFSQTIISDEYQLTNNLLNKNGFNSLSITSGVTTPLSAFSEDNITYNSDKRDIFKVADLEGLKYTGDNTLFDDYTITIIFSMNPKKRGFNRIIDFSNGKLDDGIYDNDGELTFYQTQGITTPLLPKANSTYTQLTITRKGSTNEVQVYVNGTYINSFIDSDLKYKFPDNRQINFIKDDTNEQSITNVAYLGVHNRIQTAAEISATFDKTLEKYSNNSYYFIKNLSNTTADNNLFINPNTNQQTTYNYLKVYDSNCGLNRDIISLENNTELVYQNNVTIFNDFSINMYHQLSTTSGVDFKLLDFDNGNAEAAIYQKNDMLFFGNTNSNITLDSSQNFNLLTFTKDGYSKRINVYVNAVYKGYFDDINDIYKFNSEGKLYINRKDNLAANTIATNNIAFLQITSNIQIQSDITATKIALCSKTIDRTFNFNNTLLDNSKKLGLRQSISNNNSFETDLFENCATTTNTIYKINPTTKLTFNDAPGLYYKDYTLNLYYNNSQNVNKTRLIDFISNNPIDGIYHHQKNIILIANGVETSFPINLSFATNYSILTITRNYLTKQISLYTNGVKIGTYQDTNDNFIINDSGDINLLNNSDSTLNPIKFSSISVKNRIQTDQEIALLFTSTCIFSFNETYLFKNTLDNESKSNQLTPASNNDEHLNNTFLTDVNTICGTDTNFYNVSNQSSLIYHTPNSDKIKDYTINVYFHILPNENTLNQLIEFDNGKTISLSNTNNLVFEAGYNSIDISTELQAKYNLYTFVYKASTKQFTTYINGTFFGTFIDSQNYYQFPKTGNLVLFKNSAAIISNLNIKDKISTQDQTDAFGQNLCIKIIDREFPLFLNLTDSKGQTSFTPVSYINEHTKSTFIQDSVVNCGVSRNVYYVADNAGLNFNEGRAYFYNDYTISMYFRLNPFEEDHKWSRLIDFSNGREDAGIYRLAGALNFFPKGDVGAGLLSNSHLEYTLLSLTRNHLTKEIRVYINGVFAATYLDDNDLYRIPKTGNIIFIKDNEYDTPYPYEQSPTNLAYIRVSNTILNDVQISKVFDNLCTSIACTQPPTKTGNKIPSKVGISTQKQTNSNWPANINGGNLVLESKEKGLVIPRVSSIDTAFKPEDLYEGMIVYDKDESCIKLYNGQTWKCITANCVQ